MIATVDDAGVPVVASDATTALLPASTLKLLTAAAAVDLLKSGRTREANLAAGHRIAGAQRKERSHAHAQHVKEHFGE